MTLPNALTALVGCPTFIAMRPTGTMLCLSNQLAVLRIGKSGPYHWAPMFTDLVALDWQVFTPEQMKAMRDQALKQAAGELAKGEGDTGNG